MLVDLDATEEDLTQAVDVLVHIAQIDALLPLLQNNVELIRIRAATTLAEIGDEQTLPALDTALHAETKSGQKTLLICAISKLENQSPPQLTIQLMGGFALWRGRRKILPEDWPRPVVLPLFQLLPGSKKRIRYSFVAMHVRDNEYWHYVPSMMQR